MNKTCWFYYKVGIFAFLIELKMGLELRSCIYANHILKKKTFVKNKVFMNAKKTKKDNISYVMHSKRWILDLKMISGRLEKIISFELVIDGILFANQFFTVMQYLEFVILQIPKMHRTKLHITSNKPSTRGSISNGCI